MTHGLNNQQLCRTQRGFTLVELLVVITIIGILIALLLPAVQAAREAARKAQCGNNIKQLAMGCLQHESANGFFPTGGWAYYWVGDPDRGFDEKQPGGWCYNILPYIEQQPLHDLGIGTGPGSAKSIEANDVRRQTPLTTFTCPSRRTSIVMDGGCTPYYCSSTRHVSTCYVANGGETSVYLLTPTSFNMPTSYASVDDGSYKFDPQFGRINGICFVRSKVKIADITDGASNTFLVGEKQVNPDHYEDGLDAGDDWGMFTGSQDDIVRGCGAKDGSAYYPLPPSQDTPGNGTASLYFGSAHTVSLNMSMCDGSVHSISYDIDFEVFRRFCNREDGMPVDGKSL
jgi:prepilin-type N-terminal cleavage/methylation domain-containing protein